MVAGVALALVFALVSVWWSYRSRTPSRRWPIVSQVSPIMTYPGDEHMPAASADGVWLAFSWQREHGDHQDIYVIRADGLEQPRRLTHDASASTVDAYPAWSPDGLQVAFVRRRGASAGDIIVIPSQGGEERILREIRTLSFPASSWLAWTPDEEEIAFASASLESGRSTLYSMRLSDGSTRTLLSPPQGVIGDASPAYSPDGRSLAFLRWSSPTTSALLIQKIGPGGTAEGEPSAAFTGASVDSPRSVSWADNHRLLFVTQNRIMEWEPGTAPEQVYPSGSRLAGLAIAGRDANGNPRLVTAQRNAQADVWKIPLRGPGDAGGPPQPLPLGNDSGNPDYSPDNKRLVFVSDRTGKQELWTANADGSNLHHLGLGLAHVGTPRWSPDSQHIAFFGRRNPDSKPQIYVIDVNQEHPVAQQVTKGEGCIVPTWSRNGKFVYCSRNAGGGEVTLYRVPIENGAAGSGEMEKWFEGKEGWESDDGRILFIKNSRPGLFARSLTGDPKVNLDDRLVTDIQGPTGYLAPVAEGVYYASHDSLGYTPIRFFDYARKKSMALAPKEITGPVNSLAVSSDGRSLLYTRVGDAEFDLILVSF